MFSLNRLRRVVVEVEIRWHEVHIDVRIDHENLIPLYIKRVLIGLMVMNPLLGLWTVNQILSFAMNRTSFVVCRSIGCVFNVDLVGNIN